MDKTFKILLLEDSETDAYLLKKFLDRQFTFHLDHVIDKDDFEKALKTNRYDIILADYNLPSFSGKEALMLVQEHDVVTPIIIFSGSLSPAQQIECLELNAADVIDKADINRIPYVIRRAIAEFLDRQKLNEALGELQKSVREKEILVGEIHHRVKNNLAVISGLLELSKFQSTVDDSVRKIFDDNIMRIKAISLVHETLYQDNQMTHVSIAKFIHDLLLQTRQFYAHMRPNVSIIDSILDMKININQAVPLGLIVTELVTNAMKHAFLNEEEGEIHVQLTANGEQALLSVKDNGVGLPENFDIALSSSFGFTLVNQLVMQIDGDLNMNSKPHKGADTQIQFQLSEKKGSSSAMKNGQKIMTKNYSHLLQK